MWILRPSSRGVVSSESRGWRTWCVMLMYSEAPLTACQITLSLLHYLPFHAHQAAVCSNVSGGVGDAFPCACGVTINATQVCGVDEVCVATNDTDGQCKAAACSNVSGGVSDAFPCTCGVTTNATPVCGAGEVCVATNDTDGQCKACMCWADVKVGSKFQCGY